MTAQFSSAAPPRIRITSCSCFKHPLWPLKTHHAFRRPGVFSEETGNRARGFGAELVPTGMNERQEEGLDLGSAARNLRKFYVPDLATWKDHTIAAE